MSDLKPCPIAPCGYMWRTKAGLEAHLYNDHLKAGLIKWILDHLGS